MITDNDLDITPEELENAASEIRQKWGSEVEEKLEDLLEYQITTEVEGLESQQRHRVILHYKLPKSFEEFHEEFESLLETYQERNEEFEVSELEEFERLVDRGSAPLLENLRQEQVKIQDNLKLANAIVAELTPPQIKKLAQREDVEYLEVDKPVKLELDQSAKVIGVVNARTKGLSGTGKGIIVAVLDGEVDSEHPDLKGRVVRKRNYTNEEWGKPHPHGTHVAGIIAGNGSQYKGMAPEVTIWSYKLFLTGSAESLEGSKSARALEDVIKDLKQGVKIANCSWGQSAKPDGKSLVTKTMERAVKLGLIAAKSAGNKGSNPGTITVPADANGDLIVVGASSHDGTKVMSFSSRGPTTDNRPKPDLLAPGEKIISAKVGGGYRKMSGTSMATPHVSGCIALMLEQEPKLKPWQVKKILMESAKALDSEKDPNIAGKGLVDFGQALEMVKKPSSEQGKESNLTYSPEIKKRKLLEQLSVSVRNTGKKRMQTVKASLISKDNHIKVTSAEQDYGDLRVSKDATRDFAIEVTSNTKSGKYPLTLNVSFSTPTGEKKTQSHQLTYQVPNLPPSMVTQGK